MDWPSRITGPAYILMEAADQIARSTTAPNPGSGFIALPPLGRFSKCLTHPAPGPLQSITNFSHRDIGYGDGLGRRSR